MAIDKGDQHYQELGALIRDSELERLELMLSRANIFDILGIRGAEVRHSNFLAWLLRPDAGHGLRGVFLKMFLKDVFAQASIDWANEFLVDAIDPSKVIIERERAHIDLLLRSETFVVVIENKIWSGEHSDQLSRYVKAVEKEFPQIHKVFVFLTPYGDEPAEGDYSDLYINYSYSAIAATLDNILAIYGDSLTTAVRQYITDYLAVLRRDIMKDDEVIRIAQDIYRNHQEALDFILENKPDRMTERMPIFVEAMREAGYVPESQNKGYARFLTPRLDEALPRTGLGGFKNNEPFLFELSYWGKNLTLKTVIGPGNEVNRKVLVECLKTVEGAIEPRTRLWSTLHSHKHAVNVMDDKYDDSETLKIQLVAILAKEATFIRSVEGAILHRKAELSSPEGLK